MRNGRQEEPMGPTGEHYLRGLREDHARFSRVLTMFGRDARRGVGEPEAVLPLFSEAVDYVVHYQNIHHHPREETMFAKVADMSETLADTAARLSQEHEGTDRAGEELLAAMNRASNASSQRSERQDLARQLERFARSMRGHIAQEEEILYSEAWDKLSPADWDDLVASAPDPLESAQDDRYPLLAEYVRAGQTHSNVRLDNSPFGEAVQSGLGQLSALTRQLGSVTATVRRQQREACELTLESMREMPIVPILRPQQALRASVETTQAFTTAYGRWLGEWRSAVGASDASAA